MKSEIIHKEVVELLKRNKKVKYVNDKFRNPNKNGSTISEVSFKLKDNKITQDFAIDYNRNYAYFQGIGFCYLGDYEPKEIMKLVSKILIHRS